MLWLAYVLTLLALLLAVGTLAWKTPWIGLVGSLGGYLPGWLIVLGAAGAIAGVVAWTLDPTTWALAATVLSLMSATVGVRVIIDQRRALAAAGVVVRASDFFGPFPSPKDGPDEVVTYGPVDGHSPRMGIYLPARSDSPSPVVVHVHGGGWGSGDETSDSRMVRQLTGRGYLVFTPSYTYTAEGAPTWELGPRQIARALVEIRGLAAKYGGAADRIYLMGSSAGGQLAPLVANRIAEGDALGQDVDQLPAIATMALLIPAVDPGLGETNSYVPAGAVAKRLVHALVGGTAEEFPERYAAISATGHLSPASPPALLIYGPNDWLVPSEGAIAYIERSHQLGVEVKPVAIPWTGHLMGLNGAAGRAFGELTAEWFEAHA